MEPGENLSQSERIKRLRQAMYSRSLSKDIRMRLRRDLKEIDYGVPNDFTEETTPVDQTLVAPRTIGTMRTMVKWFLVASVIFFIGAAFAFVYYFVFGAGSTVAAPGNIDISVRGPLTIVGGEPAKLQVIVTNRNQAELELTDLILKYPDGTRSATDFLTALPESRIPLGSIEPGGQRQGTVSAVFMGKEGTPGEVKVEVEYRIKDSNAIFVSDTTYAFNFATAPVNVTLEANKETISGQRVAITATISSDTSAPLRDVLVEAEYPFGFTPETLTPEPTKDNIWSLGDLNPGETRTIVIRGTLKGQQDDERIFRMRAGTRKDKDALAIDSVLSETTHHMVIARPFLGLAVAVNKESGDDAVTVAAGESVNVVISWVNNLPNPIENAVLVARLSGVQINGSTFQTNDGFYRSADKTILFDRTTTRGQFSKLDPGTQGTVSFSFTMPEAVDLATVRDAAIDITVHAAGKRLGETKVPETLQSTASRTVKVGSDVKLIGQAFYYQNPFGSVGPLPPKVDQETTYALVFTVSNTSNKIEKTKIKAQLPPYVRWIGVYSPKQEKVTFNAAEGTIGWEIGDLAPGLGVGGVPPRQVAFAIGFTPSSSQIGEQPALVRELTLTGKDAFTGRDVSAVATDVTTNLIDDPGFSTTEASVEP